MILAIYHEAHREALLLFVSTQNNVHDRAALPASLFLCRQLT